MSPAERRALLLVLALGVAGHLIRAGGGDSPPPPAALLFDRATDGDPLAHRDLARALAAPLGANERIDINRASAAELGRLPGVGPALAGRIVADRQQRGAFGGIASLDRVSGIGPATLARLTPHLSFGGAPADSWEGSSDTLLSLNQASIADLERLPGVGPRRAGQIVAFRDTAGPFRDAFDLRRVPGLPVGVADRLVPLVRVP
jgi:competence ComEA-like helix-hairpin-helix protein